MPPKRNDEKLREVKAFLQRVQTLEEDSLPLTGGGTAIARRQVRPQASSQFSCGSSVKYLAGLVLIAASVVTVLVGDWPIEPSGTPAGKDFSGDAQASFTVNIFSRGGATFAARELSPDAAIGNALQLMDTGHILAARRLLLRPDVVATQDGAWRLARSYDPNYLASVPSPDALPDKHEAAEWYRRWRDIGVRNGMVMDDLRLKRIIDSMH